MRALSCIFGYFIFTVFASAQKYDFVVLNASEGGTNSTYVKSKSGSYHDPDGYHGEYRLYDYVELAEGDSATVCTIHQLEIAWGRNHTRLVLEREDVGAIFAYNLVSPQVGYGSGHIARPIIPNPVVLPGPGKVYLGIQDYNASNRSNYNSRITISITRAEDQQSEYKLRGRYAERRPTGYEWNNFTRNITVKNGLTITTSYWKNSISGETTNRQLISTPPIVLESGDYAQVVSVEESKSDRDSTGLSIIYNFDPALHNEFDEAMQLARMPHRALEEDENGSFDLYYKLIDFDDKALWQTDLYPYLIEPTWIVGPCIIGGGGCVLKISRASDTGSKTLAWNGTSWEVDDDGSRQASYNSSQYIDPTNIKYDKLFGWAYITDSNWVYSYTNLSWYYLHSTADGIYVWNANLPNNGWMKWNRG